MNDYVICGIQQVGIGVKDLSESWKWYIKHFGMDCRIFEDEAEARLMLPYTGGKPRSRHAVLAMNLQSGGGFEIWQYKGRVPVGIENEIRLGDLGIIACRMKVRNMDDAWKFYNDSGITVSEKPTEDPSGMRSFFVKDPYGNLFQIVERDSFLLEERKISGGSYGVTIGVSDIDKAKVVYSDILGYNEVAYDVTGVSSDLKILPGGDQNLRRVLLRRSEPVSGPFSKLFGQSELELISAREKPGKRIFDGRFWGDLGFIHLCFDIRGMDQLKDTCRRKGFPFTVDSKESHEGNSFDMGEAAGHFAYIADPDGTLIEFVEAHKIPLIKKLGWYLDLKKRDPKKSIPLWMIKSLRFSKVKL